MSLSSREYLGSHRLLRSILSGRTCSVWEAIDDDSQQRYALKILLAEDAQKDRSQITMMKHEYAVAGKLDHPNVLKIHQYGIDQGIHYLVMELCDPRNLKQEIRDGAQAFAPRAQLAIEGAAQALEYFHRQGWIHRDIKPDNLIMGQDNVVKLIDFAIAQRIPKGLGKLFGGKSKIQGTMSYMSPEQIRGNRLDARADIYSFGCTIFELLAGKVPYTGESANDLLNKHLKASVPSVTSANSNITPEMAKLIARMMAKSPDDRPDSMTLVLQELRGLRVFRIRPK